MQSKDRRRFILWSHDCGHYPLRDQDGNSIVADGVVGRITIDNAFLTMYCCASRQDLEALPVGHMIPQVEYTLCGSRGQYDIYRVDDCPPSEDELLVEYSRILFSHLNLLKLADPRTRDHAADVLERLEVAHLARYLVRERDAGRLACLLTEVVIPNWDHGTRFTNPDLGIPALSRLTAEVHCRREVAHG